MTMRVSVLLLVLFAACSHADRATSMTCETMADCTDPASPFCVANACQACDGSQGCTIDEPRCSPDTLTCVACVGDADCDNYGTAPHCAPTGICVGCIDATQCANPTPTCDQTTSTCRGCIVDADCDSNVCESSSCVDASTVRYAAPDGSDNATCAQDDPCSFTKAVSAVDAAHGTIKLGAGMYTQAVTISGDTTVTIHGDTAQMGAELDVYGTSTFAPAARIVGLTFSNEGFAQCGASAAGKPIPSMTLDSVVFDASVSGIYPVDTPFACAITILRSQFHNPGVAIQFSGELSPVRTATLVVDQSLFDGGDPSDPQILVINYASIAMTNSVMLKAGGASDEPDIFFYGTGVGITMPSTIDFSTIIGPQMKCPGPNGTIIFTITNSIFENPMDIDAAQGFSCEWHYSIMQPQAASLPGSLNMPGVDPMFVNVAADDFHLLATSPAKDAADPAATDDHDYDGTPRPQNGRSDIGAFEYKP